MLELDELIAIMEYKAKNIKAHISPATINQIVEILRQHKVVTEDFAKNHRGVKGEMGIGMKRWEEKYEQFLKENYTCKVTNLPCSNCSKYGCDNREENKKTV